jgi:hypothetical protein
MNTDERRRENFSFFFDTTDNNTRKFVIPCNLKDLADTDPWKHLVAGIACSLSNNGIYLVPSTVEWKPKQLQEKNLKIFSRWVDGTVFMLGDGSERRHDKPFDGSFGHGASYVVHSALHKKKFEMKYFNGIPHSLNHVITKSPWGDPKDPDLQRLHRALKIAAEDTEVKYISSYLKSYEGLIGQVFRREYPWMSPVGVLSEDELALIKDENSGLIERVRSLPTAWLKDKTIYKASAPLIDGVESTLNVPTELEPCDINKFVNEYKCLIEEIEPLRAHLDFALKIRFSQLKTFSKGKKRAGKKRAPPILEQLNDVEILDYIENFHPLLVIGKQFSIEEGIRSTFYSKDKSERLNSLDKLGIAYSKFIANSKNNPQWFELASKFFKTNQYRLEGAVSGK